MGKLEEALRPVFDLLGLSFSQQFDPEMKPLSFLRPLHEEAIPGDGAGIINPTRLHPYLFFFFSVSFLISICLLFDVYLCVCLTVSKFKLRLNCCRGAFDMSLTRLKCSASYRPGPATTRARPPALQRTPAESQMGFLLPEIILHSCLWIRIVSSGKKKTIYLFPPSCSR